MNILNQSVSEKYTIYQGDCVEVLQGLPADSVHFSIFSRRLPASTPILTATETWATAKTTRSFRSIFSIF